MNRPLRLCCAVAGVLAVGFLLSACGRKGALDPPPSASAVPGGGPASQPGPLETDSTGKMIAPRGPAKKIPADWLID